MTGILAEEAARQNEKFFHWHRTGRPFVHLKMAVSLDGRIATYAGDSRGITGEESLKRVHDLRYEYDAILIGANTATVDNPQLTDRSGKPRHRPLARVVLDNSLRLPLSANLVLTAREIPTIIFTSSEDAEKITGLKNKGVEVVQTGEGGRDLTGVLNELGKRGFQSVLVEGGTETAGSFYDAGLIDKVSFFIAPLIIAGKDAPAAIGGTGAQRLSSAMRLQNVGVTRQGEDIEVTGYPEKEEAADSRG